METGVCCVVTWQPFGGQDFISLLIKAFPISSALRKPARSPLHAPPQDELIPSRFLDQLQMSLIVSIFQTTIMDDWQ